MVMGNKKSGIEKLEDSLYSRRDTPTASAIRKEMGPGEEFAVSSEWSRGEDVQEKVEVKKEGVFFKRLFFASILFFLIAVGIALYVFFGGLNSVSSKNVDISVLGVVAIGGGEELVLDVTVGNKNKVTLEDAYLSINYPEGTRDANDINTELLRYKEPLGEIPPGKSVTKTIKSVLFGEKNSIKNLQMTVEYKTKGSNATFSKEKTYEVAIKSSPVLIEVSYPREVNTGQNVNMTVNVVSNSTTLVRDLLLSAEYPFGFAYQDATPKPLYDNNVWRIGDLKPKEKRVIVIKGRIDGQNEEEKTFRFHSGVASGADEKTIKTDFIVSAESILIKKPFISLDLQFDRDIGKEHVTSLNKRVQGVISWFNNLPVEINNARVEVRLIGSIFDRASVSVDKGGFYRSIDNTIIWDRAGLSKLSKVDPAGEGEASFGFSFIPSSSALLSTLKNPEMTAEVNMKGTIFSDTRPPEEVSSTFTKKIKIGTDLGLNARLVYSVGPFKNIGQLPPKAERETTYTVVWTVNNSFNNVGDVVASATLPQYVTWLGLISPVGENVSFNSENRTVIWDMGEVEAGTGFSTISREVAFQVSFLPSLSQVGSVPIIVENPTITGKDRFTEKDLKVNKPSLSTKLSTDPGYDFGDEVVVK